MIIRLTLPSNYTEAELKELAFVFGVRISAHKFNNVFEAAAQPRNMLYFVWDLGVRHIPFNMMK